MPEYTYPDRQILMAEALAWGALGVLDEIDFDCEFNDDLKKLRIAAREFARKLRDYNDQFEVSDDNG